MFPEGKDASARVVLIREVEAVVVRRIRLPIKELDTLVVEAAAGMIVNDVCNNGDPVEMAQVDERFELVDLA